MVLQTAYEGHSKKWSTKKTWLRSNAAVLFRRKKKQGSRVLGVEGPRVKVRNAVLNYTL